MRVTFKETVLGVIFASLFFLIYSCYIFRDTGLLKIYFLDVGQGDATLFVTPKHFKVLIDGGRDKKVVTRLGENLSFLDKKINLVVATHDDSDHITGLIDVLKNYSVDAMIYSLPNSESELSKLLIKTAQENNVKIITADKPNIIKTSDNVIFEILFPVQDMDKAESNDASIVTQIIFNKNKILTTGDLSQSGEIFLKKRYGDKLKSDILKLGHHGSDTSSNPEFLQVVDPEVAIVSAGLNNSFGHPHKSVLDLLEKFKIKLYRTDQEGTLEFASNGVNIWKD